MSDYELHPAALADLDAIWEYIANDNLDAADRVIAEVFDSFRTLVTFPDQGFRRADLTTRPLRFKLVRDFLIAYAPADVSAHLKTRFFERAPGLPFEPEI